MGSTSENVSSEEHYLEEILNGMESVPNEIREKLKLVRQFDIQCYDLSQRLQSASAKHVAAIHSKYAAIKNLQYSQASTYSSQFQTSFYNDSSSDLVKVTTDFGVEGNVNVDFEYVVAPIEYDIEGNEAKMRLLEARCIQISEAKITLVNAVYELLDKHIQSMDTKIRKVESGLRKGFGDVGTDPIDRRRVAKYKLDDEAREIKFQLAHELTRELERQSLDGTDGTTEASEQLYCFCQKVSFGDMVACDDKDCKYEWFHFLCVGLETKPKGDWYCPQCRKKQKRKKPKKKKNGRRKTAKTNGTASESPSVAPNNDIAAVTNLKVTDTLMMDNFQLFSSRQLQAVGVHLGANGIGSPSVFVLN